MFGQDPDILARQRAAANRKYAEDLRQQIADRQTQNRPPVSFVPPKDPSPRRPPSLIQQAQQASIARPAPRSQLSDPPRALSPLPDLPPSGPSPDAIRFADRLNWLESSVDQHQSVLRSASDSAQRIERQSLPALRDGVDKLQSAIDRIAQVDLPGRLRPLEDAQSRLEEQLSSAGSDFAQQLQEVRDSLSQTSSAFSETQSKFTEFADSVKSTAQEFRAEISQSRDFHDSLCQRLSQAEARATATEESLRAAGAALQSFERAATDGVARAQQQLTSLVSSASQQIAQDLRAESEERDRASAELHARTEEVNQKAAANVVAIQTGIGDLSASFAQSLAVLSSSVKDALEATRDDADTRFRELSQRYDEVVAQLEANFAGLQTECVATVGLLSEHAVKAREDLEAALSKECETRRRNEVEIVRRYDNFKALIVNEMQVQTSQMDAMAEAARRKVTERCTAAVGPLRAEVVAVKDQTRGAEGLPGKIDEIEVAVKRLNASLAEGLGKIGKMSAELQGNADKLKVEADAQIQELGKRIGELEHTADKSNFVTQENAQTAFDNLEKEFGDRMAAIQEQIGGLFTSLGNLPTDAQEHERPSSGPRKVQELAGSHD